MWPFKAKKPGDHEAQHYKLVRVHDRQLYDKVCEMFRTVPPCVKHEYELMPGMSLRAHTMFLFPEQDHCVFVRRDSFPPGGYVYSISTAGSGRVELCRVAPHGDTSHDTAELHNIAKVIETDYPDRKAKSDVSNVLDAVSEAMFRGGRIDQ